MTEEWLTRKEKMEKDKTYWFHKSGIYRLEGPVEADNFGRNEGKAFRIRLINEGGASVDPFDTEYWAHSKSPVRALREGIKYFTGPDYEADMQELSACGTGIEGEQDAS